MSGLVIRRTRDGYSLHCGGDGALRKLKAAGAILDLDPASRREVLAALRRAGALR